MKPKLCYILPRYDEKDATHFAHLHDFLEEAAKLFDILLLIERGTYPSKNFGTRIEVFRFQKGILRIGEAKIRIFLARLRGYSNFYIHYSFLSAYIASWITMFMGGKVFYWNCGEPWKYKRNFFRNIFERFTYRLIDILVTGTEGMKKQYSEYYKISEKKIAVMPNWISLSRFSPDGGALALRVRLNIPPQSKVALFAHRLSKRKGAHYLPRIAEHLQQEDITFVIIGDGPEKENIQQEFMRLNRQDRVRFLGNIPNIEMPLYYALSDVFMMPSDEEGFPRVMLEAMVMGTPFVAFDVGGVKEIVPAELLQFVAPEGDVDTFANIMKGLISLSAEETEKIAKIEKEWVRQFNVSAVVTRFSEILHA